MTKEEFNKTHSFECDRLAKDKLIKYFKRLGESKNFTFILNEENDKDKFARMDIKFWYVKNNKKYPYSIEVKYRRKTYKEFIEEYSDVMYEEEKIDYHIQESKNGVHSYFVNLFSDDMALVFEINENFKYSWGVSYQYKQTEGYCKSKERMVKPFIKFDKGKLININD